MDTSDKIGCGVILIVVVALVAWGIGSVVNAISVEEATNRLAELAGVSPAEVEVVRHSNNMLIVGDPNDIVLEMIIHGEHVSGRCSSGALSPMVCRLYTDD